MQCLFHIDNLSCGYNSSAEVLRVPRLQIFPGKIYIVLGKSGSGKSTLLETLALMNHTFRSGSVLFNPPSLNGSDSHKLEDFWEKGDKEQLSEVRRKHFSFIFQQTNLMPNFTVYENIYAAKLMQGESKEECEKATYEILSRIGMSFIDSNRKVTELSGGQRQRVAFARAIISSYDVLFGDEPTGNLDEVNSVELLGILKEYIKGSNGNNLKTAVIVTHNIDLAARFADHVLVISKTSEEEPGKILAENCFEKVSKGSAIAWKDPGKEYSSDQFKRKLQELFSSEL